MRVDAGGVSAVGDHRVAHGGEVDEDGDASEVLEQDARGHELDLAALLASEARGDDLGGIGDGLLVVAGASNDVLQQDHKGARDALGPGDPGDVRDEARDAACLDGDGHAGGADGVNELGRGFSHVPSPRCGRPDARTLRRSTQGRRRTR